MNPFTEKLIVCLANSRKMSGRCVAGKELLGRRKTGNWIRPVSSRPSEEVSEYERQYNDGSDPSILDVIEIPLIEAKPKMYQSENWLLHPDYYWVRKGRASWSDLAFLVDTPAALWINEFSSYNGLNDRVPESIAESLDSSLYLVRVSKLHLEVSQPGIAFGNPKRSVQGRFQFEGVDYWLRVTDPNYEREYLAKPDGSYVIGECCLTVSLGDLYDGHAYKLIAAIIEAN